MLLKKNITISSKIVSLDDFCNVVFENYSVELDASCIEALRKSHEFLIGFSKDKIIYGVNTGFGPMAQHIIPKDDLNALQYNLIRSHSSGSGNVLSSELARAITFARLVSMSKAFSGVHESTVQLLATFLNNEIAPQIFEHGGVGASGDLVQLSHLALGLIGEGELLYRGKNRDAKEVFQEANITPLKVYLREGLSLINGTSAMTGIGLVNVWNAKKLLNWSLIMSAFLNEITESYDDHHSDILNGAKMHKGQTAVAEEMRKLLVGSQRTKNRYASLKSNDQTEDVLVEKLQEYYSIRCVPQVLGPIKDTIESVEAVLIAELNSANDNPIVDYKGKNVLHGGNFHGDYVSLEMDKLKIAITKLSMLCERQINFLMNSKINDKLSPFINLGRLGLNFGIQGMQFTATSTTAENQMLSNPMYVHSIPTNNDNQDIVSMGTNAALITKKVIDNSFEVMAIGMMSVLQAVDYLEIKDSLSTENAVTYSNLRQIVETIIQDKPRYREMKNLVNHLKK